MDSSDRSLQKINDLLQTGLGGGRLITGTSLNTGQWIAIQTVSNTKFHTLTGNISGVANTTSGSAPDILAGFTIYGNFSALQLHSGSVIAYNA